MRRSVVCALVAAGLSLMAPAAEAAPAPTLSASRSAVASGDPVTLRGKVAAGKQRVVLQRRTPSKWRAVSATRSGARGAYRFRVVPADGDQRYRVRLPGRSGRAGRSAPVKVRVLWQPTLALTRADHSTAPGGAVTSHVVGTSTRLAGATLVREVLAPGAAWIATGSTIVAADGRWSSTFASAHGDVVRFVAPASGARRGAASGSVAVDGSWTPHLAVTTVASADGSMSVTGSVPGVPAGTAVHRQAVVGATWATESTTATVADGAFRDGFTTVAGRSYRYLVPAEGPRREVTSHGFVGPAVAPTPEPEPEPAAARLPIGATTSVQLDEGVSQLDLLVDLDAGQTVTYHADAGVAATLVDPSGDPVADLGTGGPVTFTATDSGDHRLRLSRVQSGWALTVNVTLSEPLGVTTSLDAAGTDLDTTLPGQRVDLSFVAAGGTLVSEHAVAESCCQPPPGRLTLVDPAGEPVARYGRSVREGHNWLLPELDGTYVLRIEPEGIDATIDRAQQAVLTGDQVTAELDGAPAHLSLDRAGEVGLVQVTVPAGADVTLSDTGPAHLARELFAPDGSHVDVYSTVPRVASTRAGTYRQLVSYDGTAELDAYASTPLELDLAQAASTSYDLGPAPSRPLRGKFPVIAGELFSVEVLDDLGLCTRDTDLVAGEELIDWMATVEDQPTVVRSAQSGSIVLALSPCERWGTVRLQGVEIVEDELVSATTTPEGHATTITRATLAAPTPGRLMVVAHRAGSSFSDRVTLRASSSTFAPATGYLLAKGAPETSLYRSFGMAGDPFPLDYTQVRGPQLLFVYAGPFATGTLELEIELNEF